MRILLATDLSNDATTALRAVQRLALPPDSHVRTVHAVEPVATVELVAPAAMLMMSDAAEDDVRAALREGVRDLERTGVRADGIVGHGRAADVIIDECASFVPDLVVVGSRGRGAIATAVLGSVSAEVVDRAPCPVLVARRSGIDTVILAEDGSAAADAGARAILALRPVGAARVVVVSVVDSTMPLVSAEPSGVAAAAAYDSWHRALPKLRDTHLELARTRAQALEAEGIRATYERREGSVVTELIAAAVEHGADCIAVGSRGQTGLRRLVLGSVARGVLFGAPCSVLVAHPSAAASPAVRADAVAGATR